MRKIAIVGGGPGGSYLADNLTLNGFSPVIFDDSHPRDKPCGGGISSSALKRFGFLKEIEHLGDKANKLRLISPGNREALLESEHHCWAVSRRTFDKYLLDKALNNGAELIKERVVKITKKNGIWTLETKECEYEADILVGADGVNSIVRKSILGPIPKENLGLVTGYYADRNIDDTDMFKYLKDKPGYAYMFKRLDDISIGVGTYLDYSKGLTKDLNQFIEQYCPNLKIKSEQWSHLCPCIRDVKFYNLPTAGKDWILIGDAAGHVDPLTYEGIAYALWGAELAAKAIYENKCESFNDLWRKEYLNELKSRCRNVNINYHPLFQEIQIGLASRSKTFGKLLYDTTNGIISINNLNTITIRHSPAIIKEVLTPKRQDAHHRQAV